MSQRESEAEFLKNVVTELEDDGYEVFLQPQSPILPPFLKDFRPDAIARRGGQHLVVEVLQSLTGNESKLAAITAAIRANPGWELRVHLVSPTARQSALTKQPLDAIRTSTDEIQQLVDSGYYRAALLMAWSTFEAIARITMPSDFERPQSPGRLVQLLAQEGYVTPSEADILRRLAEKRNVLIHGNIQTDVTKADVEGLTQILRKLIELQQAAS
jgi:uncharacterized protein YutE (UPF0331/DUF86 family)